VGVGALVSPMKNLMPPPVRLFGTDRGEIVDLSTWFLHAPPEGGLAHWKDGYSAKEQAKAWLRPGRPDMPEEFWSGICGFVGEAEEFYGWPEHVTKLDTSSATWPHDLFACVGHGGAPSLVIGIEAKACEGLGVHIADHARVNELSGGRAMCNALAQALFNRDVVEIETGEILDESLASHGYELWTAAVGTIIEAQARGLHDALLVVHQFKPRDLVAAARNGDERGWTVALALSASALAGFSSALVAAGSESHESQLVRAGTTIRVITVLTTFDA
jgi:uncharacterized protein DUF6946